MSEVTKDDPRLFKAFKAVGAGVTAVAFYLMGVIPASGGFQDVTTVGWLGAVVTLFGAYGVTYKISNPRVTK